MMHTQEMTLRVITHCCYLTVPGNITGLLLPAPTTSHPDATDGGVEQEPPVPPPRPTGRSMSMDASKGRASL